MLVEPKFMYVNYFIKDETGKWQSAISNKSGELLQLKKHSIELPLHSIYNL